MFKKRYWGEGQWVTIRERAYHLPSRKRGEDQYLALGKKGDRTKGVTKQLKKKRRQNFL